MGKKIEMPITGQVSTYSQATRKLCYAKPHSLLYRHGPQEGYGC